jgi:hypothetical protein
MKKCITCGDQIPSKIWVDGVKKTVSGRRKKCYKCCPFGERWEKFGEPIPCEKCGKIGHRKAKLCWTCSSKNQIQGNLDKLYCLLGGSICWICGYNKCSKALDFHHVDESTKIMNLSNCEMQYSWSKIWAEAEKCALLCVNCHKEYHGGLISAEEMKNVYVNNWDKINQNLEQRLKDYNISLNL